MGAGTSGEEESKSNGNMAKMKNPAVEKRIAEKRRDLLVEMKRVKKTELKKMQMTSDWKRSRPLVIRELLLSSDWEEDVEVKKNKAEAWSKRKTGQDQGPIVKQ
jgi:hypothetical protein